MPAAIEHTQAPAVGDAPGHVGPSSSHHARAATPGPAVHEAVLERGPRPPTRRRRTAWHTPLLALLLALTSCASTSHHEALRPAEVSPADAAQIDALLESLYDSFNYGAGEEPDWVAMRSAFVEGAQFVSEAPAGQAPRPWPIDAFITSWQASLRRRETPAPAYAEWILETRLTRIGELISVDVLFQAERPGDPSPRKPGLDSLVLARVGPTWKVLSFVVQYESKL